MFKARSQFERKEKNIERKANLVILNEEIRILKKEEEFKRKF